MTTNLTPAQKGYYTRYPMAIHAQDTLLAMPVEDVKSLMSDLEKHGTIVHNILSECGKGDLSTAFKSSRVSASKYTGFTVPVCVSTDKPKEYLKVERVQSLRPYSWEFLRGLHMKKKAGTRHYWGRDAYGVHGQNRINEGKPCASNLPRGTIIKDPEAVSVGVLDAVNLDVHFTVGDFAGGSSISVDGRASWNFEEFCEILSKEIQNGWIEDARPYTKEERSKLTNKRLRKRPPYIDPQSVFHPDNLVIDWTVKSDTRDAPSYLRNMNKERAKINEISDVVMTWATLTMNAFTDEVMGFLGGVSRSEFVRPEVFK